MPRAGLNAAAIIDAAAILADEIGFDSLTLAVLSQRLNIKPPSLYKHLDGLSSIRRGIALRGLREMNTQLMQAIVGVDNSDAILAIAHAYWQFSRQHPGVYQAVVCVPHDADADIAAATDVQIGLVGAVLGGRQLQGDRLQHSIRSFRSLLQGFAMLDAAGAFDDSPSREDTLIEAVRVLVGLDAPVDTQPARSSLRIGRFRFGLR